MSTTIATLRTNVRNDLHDNDSNNYRWTDAVLNRHIERAARRFSYACPREVSDTISCAEATRAYDVVTGNADLADLLAMRAVEFPDGQYPPSFVPFRFTPPGTVLLLVDPPPAAAQAFVVHADLFHTVDANGCTIPDHLLEIVEGGAAAFAALEWANYAVNRVNVDQEAARAYRAWGSERLAAFYRDLRALQNGRAQRGTAQAAIAHTI